LKRDGEVNGEGAAFIDFAFDIDAAVVSEDYFPDDSEAESCSLDLFSRSMDAIEPAEDFVEVIWGNTHTRIGNLNNQLIAAYFC